MEYENENETTWTCQVWYSQLVKVSFLQSRIESLSTVVSAEYVSTGSINDGPTLDQRWINIGSTMDQWSININIQCVTYTRIVPLAVLSGMRERGWSCMDTINLACRNSAGHFFTVKLWPFIYFLSQICGYSLYQRWINDVLLAPPLPPLAAPDDLLLELETPPDRKSVV